MRSHNGLTFAVRFSFTLRYRRALSELRLRSTLDGLAHHQIALPRSPGQAETPSARCRFSLVYDFKRNESFSSFPPSSPEGDPGSSSLKHRNSHNAIFVVMPSNLSCHRGNYARPLKILRCTDEIESGPLLMPFSTSDVPARNRIFYLGVY